MWKKILLAVGALVGLMVIGLAAAPLLFRDTIEARVKTAINERIEARADFGDVGLSLFRNFPNLAVSLNDLTITGIDAFEGDTLAHVGSFRLVVDLGSAIRALRGGESLVVRSILVDRPYLHARVLEDGRTSWDIMKAVDEATAAVEPETTGAPDGPAATPPAISVALQRFAISDARIALDDLRSGLHARVSDLDHELEGDFAADRFALETRTVAGSVSVTAAGIPYLSGARVEAVADLDADMAARRFTFRENRMSLNELALGFEGSAAMLDDGVVDLDVTFAADRAAFRDILSLVPALFLQDFASLRAAGTVALSGHVRGRQGPTDVPSFGLDLNVADGMFQYADLPLPVQGVFVELAVANPGGDLDRTTVALDRFDLAVGDEPFQATMSLATPISDPDVDFALKGRIDLGAVSRALKLEGVDELRGVITTDVAVRTRLSWIEAERYDRIEARGQVAITDVAVSGGALAHPVAIDELRLDLAPSYAELLALRARAGSSDFQATGRLDNLLGFALRGEHLRGRATLTSRFIDLDEWRVEGEVPEDTAAPPLEVIPIPTNLDLTLAASIDSMTFGDLVMTRARGGVRVDDGRVTLDRFGMNTLDGQIVTSGWYETVDVTRPAFDFDFAMTDLDIASAFGAFNTIRALAPAAGYATGRFSADMRMNGGLSPDMMPLFDVLNGLGTVETRGMSLQGMPALHRLADAVKIDRLRDPALSDFASSIEIRDGRLHVEPFDVRVGDARMNVAGSNGIDQSIDYRIGMIVPSAELGDDANRLIDGLLAESGRIGVDLDRADAVRLDAVIGGTITRPTVGVDFGDAIAAAGASVREQVGARVQQEVDRAAEEARRRLEEARQDAEAARLQAEADARARADEAREEARARARAEADQLIAEAETQAARIRAEAADLAARTRQEGNEQADRLEAEAKNPLSKRAAKIAADRLRAETEQRATQIETEAAARADQVVAEARERADALVTAAG